MTWNNIVRCTADDSKMYYKEDITRVLKLFVFASGQRCAVEADTMHAALEAAPAIGTLPGRTAGAAAQAMLMSHGPKALAMLVRTGAYKPFGLPECCPDTKGIAKLPQNAAVRWWVFLHRCKVQPCDYAKIVKNLCISAAPEELMALDRLSELAVLPKEKKALKQLLSRMPETIAQDYAAAVQAIAQSEEQWKEQKALFDELVQSREPYLVKHLAITRAELLAAHILNRKIPYVMRGLLDAVIAAPQLNFPEALMELTPVFLRWL